jgi:hypothetical protein
MKCHDCKNEAIETYTRCGECLAKRKLVYRERYKGRYDGKYREASRAAAKEKYWKKVKDSLCKCRPGIEIIPGQHKWKCDDCGGFWYPSEEEWSSKWGIDHKKRVFKMRSDMVWATILNQYGPTCSCCGEKEVRFLTVDHVENDGNEDLINGRRHSGPSFYLKIVKEGFPKRYQILCMNCNWGKGKNGGVCPHVSSKRP